MFYILFCMMCLFTCNKAYSQETTNSIQKLIETVPEIPKAKLKRIPFDVPEGETRIIPIYSEEDFTKVDYSSNILFDIKSDIAIQNPIALDSEKKIIIKGNGYKIYQKGESLGQYKSKGKWKMVCFNRDIKGNELFLNQKGEKYQWSKSSVFQSDNWNFNDSTNMVEVTLPKSLMSLTIKESDQVFINYSMWFIRQKNKVSHVDNGKLYFKCTEGYKPDTNFRRWTKKLFFYLENHTKKEDCITWEKGKLYYPDKEGFIYQGKLKTLLIVSQRTYLDCYDISFGPALEYMMMNYGKSRFQNCTFRGSDSGGIFSNGHLVVSNCKFQDLTRNAIQTFPRSYTEVTYSSFNRIGKYGSNNTCISCRGRSYVAYNQFRDFNYSAISLGYMSTDNEENLPTFIVEHNKLNWTKGWNEEMNFYGLKDSGAIYIGTNNRQGIIRYNLIQNYGGIGTNRSIFCDDGAYNLAIYGNIISNTKNSYDIDSRDCATLKNPRTMPEGHKVNTNNFIGYNICSGAVKMEGNSLLQDNGCRFVQNIIIGDSIKNIKNRIFNNNILKEENPIIIDCNGVIDEDGVYSPAIDIRHIWNIK